MPFARAMKLLKTGQIQSISHLAKTAERETYAHYLDPVYYETMRLATHANVTVEVGQLSDISLLPGKIALQRGTFVSDEFSNKPRIQIISAPLLIKR